LWIFYCQDNGTIITIAEKGRKSEDFEVTYQGFERLQRRKAHAATTVELAGASVSARRASVAETKTKFCHLSKTPPSHSTHNIPSCLTSRIIEVNTHAVKKISVRVKIEWLNWKRENSCFEGSGFLTFVKRNWCILGHGFTLACEFLVLSWVGIVLLS
jgi:hypothetical protein